ncbi:MAG: type IV secretory pathway VirB6-like protein [Rickettsiales bacterium]|jgi:type IV secretory pathway VirB6-like protein
MKKIDQENHISNKYVHATKLAPDHKGSFAPSFKIISRLFFVFFLFLTLSYSTPSYADLKDIVRECTPVAGEESNINPYPSALHYDITDGGDDFLFDPYNPVCLAVVLPPYVGVKAAIFSMNKICTIYTSFRGGRIYPTPTHDALDLARGTFRCTVSKNFACCAAVSAGYIALASFLTNVKIQHTVAQDAYDNSYLCGNGGKDGDGSWTKWNSEAMTRNISGHKRVVEDVKNRDGLDQYNNDSPLPEGDELRKENRQYYEWFYGGVEKEDNSDSPCADVTSSWDESKHGSLQENRIKVTSGDNDYTAQRYYMRGSEPANYACDRYNHRVNDVPSDLVDDYKEAHRCCVDKSKTSVCIERKYCLAAGSWVGSDASPGTCISSLIQTSHKFCKAGTSCNVGGIASGNSASPVTYAAKYAQNDRMICVSTANLCPYDFNIGGGSLECDYFKDGVFTAGEPRDEFNFTRFDFSELSKDPLSADPPNCAGLSEIRGTSLDDAALATTCLPNKKAGRCRNYCQLMNHCVIVGASDYIYDTSITSPYFSTACLNFVGDSKNEYAYGQYDPGQISLTGTQKHFSAPIAQCFKETIENIFNGKAGHTKCGAVNEYPNEDGICPTDFYRYQKGEYVDEKSFFSRIQDNLKDIIKLVLTISIMLQGFKILLTGEVIKRKDLTIYIAKIGLVLFFATGNAWQGYFFDGVYGASASLSNVVYKSSASLTHLTGGAFSDATKDGCQFGEIYSTDGTSGVVDLYPPGKEYLAVFDSLDCKIARYLGFGPEASVASIALLIIPAMLSPVAGAIGVFFAILTLVFGIFMIIVAIRTLHIFLFCSFIVILLVYISPLAITAVLFEKTKDIFNKWLNLLIAYSLQPMMLFAYIGFFIAIFETLITGSATFRGDPPQKEMVCDKFCVDRNGEIILDDGGNVDFSGTAGEVGGNTATTSGKECDFEAGEKERDPMSDSVVCMMNMNNGNIKSNPALAPFGIGLAMLNDLVFSGDAGRQKILTMIKSVIIVYILAGFLEEIPALAAQIIGGNAISKTGFLGNQGATRKGYGAVRGAQKRAARGANKLGGAVSRTGKSANNSPRGELKNPPPKGGSDPSSDGGSSGAG